MEQPVNKDLRLGELLRTMSALDTGGLSETLKLAAQLGLPLGRALVLAGHLSEDELDAALEIQGLARQGCLSIAVATRAFTRVRGGMPLTAALKESGWERPEGMAVFPSRLGSLLFDAKIVTQKQLDEAQRTSYETGMPLGRILGLMGAISQHQLARALELQRMVRDRTISHNQAVLELHTGRAPELDAALVQHGLKNQTSGKKTIRLGELLMLAGVMNENDIMNALEQGLTSNKPLGEVLLDLGLVTQQVLDLALEMQEAICKGELNIHAASDALQYVANTGRQPLSSDESDTHLTVRRDAIRLGELLKLSGFIEESDITQAIDLSNRYPSLIGKMLVVSGAIDEATLLSALRCQFLLRNGHLVLEDAVKALQFAKARQLSLDDAMEELGIRLPDAAAGKLM